MRLKTPHLKVGLFEKFWMEFGIEQEPKSGDWWQSFDTLWFFSWGLRNIHLSTPGNGRFEISSLFRSWRWCMIIGFLLTGTLSRKRYFCLLFFVGFPDWFSSTKHKVCSTARSTSRTMKHKVRVETRTMFVPANTETPMVGLRWIFCHYVFSETLRVLEVGSC